MSENRVGDDVEKDSGEPTLAPFELNSARIDVHPLVLLSLVDHYARVNDNVTTKKRVVGLLLGQYGRSKTQQILDISNCFAIPFDEDPSDPNVWFFDTTYAEDMFQMYKTVLPKVSIVGWYSSGPTIQANDLLLHLLVAQRFCPNPVYLVVNTDATNQSVPVLAYTTTEGRGGESVEFRNVPTNVGAVEAEEIGIEFLLRDITDSTVTTLSTQVADRIVALKRLEQILQTVEDYLLDVCRGRLPVAQDILAALQEVLGLQPRIHQLKSSTEFVRYNNDEELKKFVASMARCVMALYDVILNRRRLAREAKDAKEKREAEEKKAAEEKEKKATDEKKAAEDKKAAEEKKGTPPPKDS